MTKITGFDTYDVRFPTSRTLAGSDAMNPAPGLLGRVRGHQDRRARALAGHGYAFTIGRGNDVQLAAIRLLEPFLAGQDLDEVLGDLGGLGRRLVRDSPLHWLGPSCGVMHMAIGAVLNACWDLAARRAGQPLWRLLAGLPPEEIVGLVDFRYLSDALTPTRRWPAGARRGRAGERIAALRREGIRPTRRRPGGSATPTSGWPRCAPRPSTRASPGEAQGRRRARGRRAPLRDRPRGARRRDRHGHRRQPGLGRADRIGWVRELAPFGPPGSRSRPPGGHARHRRHPPRRAPVRVATGEHVANRVMFKQLLQAGAIDIMQIDACRVAGSTRTSPTCCWPPSSACRLPARRRRGPVRDRPAPGDVRLRGPVRHPRAAGSSGSTTCTSTSSSRPWSPAAATARREAPARPPRCGPSRWPSSPTRPARPGSGATWRDRRGAGPAGVRAGFGGAPRRAVRAGRRRHRRRHAGRRVGRRDTRLRHRSALRGRACPSCGSAGSWPGGPRDEYTCPRRSAAGSCPPPATSRAPRHSTEAAASRVRDYSADGVRHPGRQPAGGSGSTASTSRSSTTPTTTARRPDEASRRSYRLRDEGAVRAVGVGMNRASAWPGSSRARPGPRAGGRPVHAAGPARRTAVPLCQRRGVGGAGRRGVQQRRPGRSGPARRTTTPPRPPPSRAGPADAAVCAAQGVPLSAAAVQFNAAPSRGDRGRGGRAEPRRDQQRRGVPRHPDPWRAVG